MSILGYKQKPGSKIWTIIPELTLDQVVKASRPEENGYRDGADNKPGKDTQQFSETENRIVYECENYLKSVDDIANKEFTDIVRDAAPFSLEDVHDDFNTLKMETEKEYNRYVLQKFPELRKLRVEERTELRNLKLFKAQNSLERLAKYPSSRIFHVAVIIFFLAVECAFNTYFFADGTDLGYLGGFFQAFAVATGNIALAFACGRLALPLMSHIKKSWVFVGACGFGVWMGLCLVYHLLVAHYRDLLLIDPDNAMLGAWGKFWASPFGFESLESYVIMVIGIVISIAALIDGYKFDDAYPGYGKIDRDYRKKLAALESVETEVRSTMTESITSTETKISDRMKDYEEKYSKLADLYTGASSVVEYFDNIYQQVDEIVQTAVTTYRDANLKVRTDEAPVSFARIPAVKRLLNKDKFSLKLQELRVIKENSACKLALLKEGATKAFNDLAEATETLGRKIDELTEEVEKKAQAQIKKDKEVANDHD